jgi:hypothetical protein
MPVIALQSCIQDMPRQKRRRPGQALLADVFEPSTGALIRTVSLGSLPDLSPGASAPPRACGFALEGDCMSPIIQDGDLVFLRTDRPVRPGRPAAFKLRGCQSAVKLWMPRGKDVHLVPTNSNYPSIRARASDVEWALEVLLVVRFRGEFPKVAGGRGIPALANRDGVPADFERDAAPHAEHRAATVTP